MAGDLTISTINGGAIGAKNALINGNFGINQRAVSGTVTLSAGAYGHDRFKAGASGCTYTFATSNNITTLTITAGSLIQVIEGINLQSGTYTLSWTGTAQGKIGGGSYAGSGVTETVTGGTNLNIEFDTGTLSLVQLEAGSVATPFEHRQYGQELALCQRYYYQQTYDATNQPISSSAYWSTSTNIEWLFLYPVPMRATPSISFTTIGGLFALESQTAWRQLSSVSVNEIGSSSVKFSGTAATNTNYATRQPSAVGLRATGSINYSAEL